MSYKIKNLLYFVFYLIINPKVIYLAIKGIYIPVYTQFEWLKKYDISTVIDVGAHVGQTAKALNYILPNAEIYAFEPSPQSFKKLQTNLRNTKVKLFNLAIFNTNGKTIFFEHELSQLSSLLTINKKFSRKLKLQDKGKKTSVRTQKLDSFFKNTKLQKNIFLKVDTQGSEYQVLESGKKLLKNISIVHIETSFDESYINQHTFDEIYSLMIKNGFKYAGEATEANFYPLFGLKSGVNSLFINPKFVSY